MLSLLFSPGTVTQIFFFNLYSPQLVYVSVNLLQGLTSVVLNLLWVVVHSSCELLIRSIANEEKSKQKSW